MRRKIISNYARNVYFPIQTMKREVNDQFNTRKDYEQVICARDISNNGIKESLAKLYFEEAIQESNT